MSLPLFFGGVSSADAVTDAPVILERIVSRKIR